jgi:carbonic anhydrase/acetyltransferase-like protein (isoleucine patch superfamily)
MIHTFAGKTPKLGSGVFLAEGAQVIGDVEIGDQSSIWFNCVVRGDVEKIRIGARTNVQDLSCIHVASSGWGTTIGDETTIGHRVVLHGCKVGARCLIGIGAVVLDGAEIGDEAMVGANALVTSGVKIPPRMLVLGTPARAVRPLTDAELQFLRENAANYVGYANLYGAPAK